MLSLALLIFALLLFIVFLIYRRKLHNEEITVTDSNGLNYKVGDIVCSPPGDSFEVIEIIDKCTIKIKKIN